MTFKRLADAFHDGDITLAQRNAYVNNGVKLNDPINIGTPAGVTVGDFDMTTDNIVNLGAAVAETDAANLSNILHRVMKHAITHDGGASQSLGTLPAKSRIDSITIDLTEDFDGTLDIGITATPDLILADADITKTISTMIYSPFPPSEPAMLGMFSQSTPPGETGAVTVIFAGATEVLAAVGTGTTGAGTVWIDYTIMP